MYCVHAHVVIVIIPLLSDDSRFTMFMTKIMTSNKLYSSLLCFSWPCQQRKLSARSDRVKCVDVHPTEPWMLASLYNGNVHVWNYESQTLVKTFEVTDLPGMTVYYVVV